MIDEKRLIDDLKRMINSDEVEGYSPAAVIHSVCKKIWEQPKVGEWIPMTAMIGWMWSPGCRCRVYCYGLYEDMSDWMIQKKCRECGAFVDNAKPYGKEESAE